MPLGLCDKTTKVAGTVWLVKVRTIAVGTEERHRLGSSLGSTYLPSFARAV